MSPAHLRTRADADGQGGPGSSPFTSIFQTPGGPPLILVCIAAGLLVGAFIGVIVVRRMRPRVVVHRATPGSRAARLAALGEKPKLYDIHIVARSDGMYEIVDDAYGGLQGKSLALGKLKDRDASGHPWALLSPFAALYLRPSTPTPSGATTTSSPTTAHDQGQTSRGGVFARIQQLRPFKKSSRDPGAQVDSQVTPSAPALRAVQLAVTVAMPVLRRRAKSPPLTSEQKPDPTPDSEQKPEHEQNTSDPLLHTPEEKAKMKAADNVGDVGDVGDDADLKKHAHDYDHDHEEEEGHGYEHPDCCIGTLIVSYQPPPPSPPPAPTPTSPRVPATISGTTATTAARAS